MHYIITCFKKYAVFHGRSARAEYWTFIVFTHMVGLLLLTPFMVYCVIMDASARSEGFMQIAFDNFRSLQEPEMQQLITDFVHRYTREHPVPPWVGVGLSAFCVWVLAAAIPNVSATVRRLRDAGGSVWWVLPPVLYILSLFTKSFNSRLIDTVGGIALLLSFVPLVYTLTASKNGEEVSVEAGVTDAGRQCPVPGQEQKGA